MSTTTPRGATRVSDAERELIAGRLREDAAEGRLSMAEVEERQAAAYAALTWDELDPLTRDLPTPEAPRPRGARELTAADRRWLGLHAAIAAALVTLLILHWTTSPTAYFWPAWPMFWLSLSVFVHYRVRRRRWDEPIRSAMTEGKRGAR
jgi:hypothetical protein